MGVILVGSILCFTMHPERPLVVEEIESMKLVAERR
jgi:hypothetical protein